MKNSYYNNNHGVLTPIRSLPYQLYISFFGILQLLLFISQFLPKVQSKFHQIRMKIVAIIDNYVWKIALFFIFEKNIDHPVNYKFQEWGKILHNEKKSDASLTIFFASDFFDFLIFSFSMQIYNLPWG